MLLSTIYYTVKKCSGKPPHLPFFPCRGEDTGGGRPAGVPLPSQSAIIDTQGYVRDVQPHDQKDLWLQAMWLSLDDALGATT
jgi:hypothetical protein